MGQVETCVLDRTTRALSALNRLCHRRVTGSAICRWSGAEVRVHLLQGRMAWATTEQRSQAFTRWLLVREAALEVSAREMVKACLRERRSLGEELVRRNVATLPEIRDAVRTQIFEAIERLASAKTAQLFFVDRRASFVGFDPRLTFELAEFASRAPGRAPLVAVPKASAPVLALRHFGVSDREGAVIADLSFELPRQSLVTVLGRARENAAFVRALARLDGHGLSTRGVAELDGQPLFGPASCSNSTHVVTTTSDTKFLTSTVRGGLLDGAGVRPDEPGASNLAERLLVEAGLDDLIPELDADVVSLPIAVQRQLAIVRAAARRPLVLLASEPTAGLRGGTNESVIGLLRRLALRCAVLFVTRSLDDARRAGGRIVLLEGMERSDDDTPDESSARDAPPPSRPRRTSSGMQPRTSSGMRLEIDAAVRNAFVGGEHPRVADRLGVSLESGPFWRRS